MILQVVPCPCFLTAILSAFEARDFYGQMPFLAPTFSARGGPVALPKKALPTRQQVTCHPE